MPDWCTGVPFVSWSFFLSSFLSFFTLLFTLEVRSLANFRPFAFASCSDSIYRANSMWLSTKTARHKINVADYDLRRPPPVRKEKIRNQRTPAILFSRKEMEQRR